MKQSNTTFVLYWQYKFENRQASIVQLRRATEIPSKPWTIIVLGFRPETEKFDIGQKGCRMKGHLKSSRRTCTYSVHVHASSPVVVVLAWKESEAILLPSTLSTAAMATTEME